MKTRAITGFFFVVVMLASVLTGQYTFSIFFMLLSLFCLAEFYNLVKTNEVKPQLITGLLTGFVLFLTVILHFIAGLPFSYLLLAVLPLLLIYITELYRKNSMPFHNISYTLTGLFFSVIPFCFFYALGFLTGSYSFHAPLSFLLLLWASDTGAYLFGIKLGKNRLFERHSPKKSWEGFFGGMFTSLLVAFILSLFYTELPALHWAACSVIIVVLGTYGDLTESMLKRSMDKKDSGSILPGHGGLLDRFDGLFLAAPAVYLYLYFFVYLNA
ncbi:phosphatidate cytidylyltransferase (plasmid) [Pedobacter sp. BS3]|uniref:phosphatidate cytidylyltransferase n=1 Tax=Pedobacter sp. BS3 TaxID=2567937 RepID=UPI0011EEC30C|nr:phosphatidate cytidylyltransferase [Pedobacter sp. BS3]TZF85717.1 phosphatidate cytidylyltransferase [Pedobacter sp. BS3]